MLKTDTALGAAARTRSHARARTKADAGIRFGRATFPYLMVAPSLGILGLFVLYPICYMVYLSFYKWNMIGPMKYLGLRNFENLLSDPDFWNVMGNTFQYTFFTVALSVGLGILVALHFKKNTLVNKVLQSALFAPYVVSLVSIAFVWMWLMDTDFGLLNYALSFFGIDQVGWLDDPKVAMYSLILVSVWKSLGYNTMILLSAMQSVPPSLYEAASLDKGRPAGVFFKITFPIISPSLFFLTLMNMIGAFKVFETVAVMTQGGPVNSTNSLVYSIYQYGFEFYKIGYASAMGVVLMLIIGALTLLYFWGLSRKVHYR